MVRFRTGWSFTRSIHGYRRSGLLPRAGSSNNGKSSKKSNLTGNFVLEFTRNTPLTRGASLTLRSAHSRKLVRDLPLKMS